jgi:hypothetical protein
LVVGAAAVGRANVPLALCQLRAVVEVVRAFWTSRLPHRNLVHQRLIQLLPAEVLVWVLLLQPGLQTADRAKLLH